MRNSPFHAVCVLVNVLRRSPHVFMIYVTGVGIAVDLVVQMAHCFNLAMLPLRSATHCQQFSCGGIGMVRPLSSGTAPLFSYIPKIIFDFFVVGAGECMCASCDQIYYFALVCSTCCYGSRAVRLAVLYSPRARKTVPSLVSVGQCTN